MQVSHHALSGEQLTQVKPLVFVLDEAKNVKEEGEEAKKSKRDKKNKHKDSKNRSKSGVSVKNFGAKLSIPAFKGATALTCAWRCRRLSCNTCFQKAVRFNQVSNLGR